MEMDTLHQIQSQIIDKINEGEYEDLVAVKYSGIIQLILFNDKAQPELIGKIESNGAVSCNDLDVANYLISVSNKYFKK